WVMELLKVATGNNEKFKRLIPLLSAILGVIFGLIAFYAVPGIMPTDNVVVALVIGGASGLTATGTNQMIKQLTCPKADKLDINEKKNETKEEDKDETKK
ncbi:MAG: hypothetical protein RR086_06080, partial [Clostridia bacterium]